MSKKFKLLFIIICFSYIFVNAEIVEKIVVNESIYSLFKKSDNVIVITDKDIKKLRINNLLSLFKMLPGVNVMRRGPADTSFDISMGGGNFEQTVVQINGIPFNNPQTGHFNTDIPITVDDIERIVITRGVSGNSSPYGLNGTVNIILKKKSKIRFSITGGEKGLFSINISKGIKTGNFDIGISGGKRNSTGYYNGNEFNISNILSYLKFKDRKFSADFSFGKLKKDMGANNFYAAYPSIESIDSFFSTLSLKKEFSGFDILFSYMKSVHNDTFILDRYNRSYYRNQSMTGKDFIRFYGLAQRKSLNFSGGFDLIFEKMESSMMGNVERKRGGVFLDISKENTNWSYDSDFRIELMQGSKAFFTYNINFFKKLREKFSLKISSGRKIRLPSFTELYYNSPANIGDKDLKREISYNHQLLLSYYKNRSVLTFSLFLKNQNNLIDWIRYDPTSYWYASNIFKRDIYGFEVSGSLNFKNGGGVSSSFERVFSLKRKYGFESKYGLRFSDLLLKIRGFFRIFRRVNVSSVYIFKRIFATEQKGDFLDISISSSIGRKYDLTFHADNLFNTIIEEIPGIKVPGRWIYMSFSLKND